MASTIKQETSRGSLKRVVLLTATRPNKRNYERYGGEFFNACGIEVIWLDVTDICHPHLQSPESNDTFPSSLVVRRIKDTSDLNNEIETFKSADLILALFTDGALTRHNFPIFRLISHVTTPYAFLINDAYPGINQYKGEAKNVLKRMTHVFSRLASVDWKTSLLFRLPFKWLGLRQANFVIHGGRKSAMPRKSIGIKTIRIFAHAHDYENFRKTELSENTAAQTAVFIDQNIFQHHDFTFFAGFSIGDSRDYYSGLNVLFDRIERELGLQVIIAAHPRADYENSDNLFSGRKIIKGETQQLVRDCQLAMTFTSQAMNFAVLYGKPMAILSTRDFYRHPCGKSYQDPMAASIGNPIVFLEKAEQENLNSLMTVDSDLYDRFIEDYIKIPDSLNNPLWEIITDKICQHQFLRKPVHQDLDLKHHQLEKNPL